MSNRRARDAATVRDEVVRQASLPLTDAEGTKDTRLRVAFALPARNEAGAIGRVLQAMPQDSTKVRYRVFVCDDGSTDGTGDVSAKAGATVLRHSRKFGIGAALTTAFEAASQWSPDVIVQVSADGQDDPALTPVLLGPILRGEADYVIGSRLLTGGVGMTPVRRVGVRFYSRLIRLLVGLRITDVTSGFRAFRADVYDQLSIRSEKNWAVEVALRAGLNHLRTVEISTPFLPRIGGQSQFDVRRMYLVYHFRAICQIFRAYTAPRSAGITRAQFPALSRSSSTPGAPP